MKKRILIIAYLLLFITSTAEASSLHGTAWRYGGPYAVWGFYNNDIYTLIDPEIAYPDPPYWANGWIALLMDVGTTTYFIEVCPIFPIFYIGSASKNTGTGIIASWFINPFFPRWFRSMTMISEDWNPSNPIEDILF